MNMKRCLWSSLDGVVYDMMICEINSSMVAEVLKQDNTTDAIEHLCQREEEKLAPIAPTHTHTHWANNTNNR